jgi:hypothetical protein
MFSACHAFLTTYETNLHTYLFARSIQDINGITKTLRDMANADSLSGTVSGTVIDSPAKAIGQIPTAADPS